MRIMCWHVHGSWMTSFVQGPHTYLVPTAEDRGPDGRGRADTYEWPDTVLEISPAQLADAEVDLVVLQRPHELALAEQWLRRRPGIDLPAVYVEHNTPKGEVPNTRHPMAGRDDIRLVHVTYFNQLMWDNGRAATAVIEHGIGDPGLRYVGTQARIGAAINEPHRRGRVVGTDVLPRFARLAPLDVYGIAASRLVQEPGYDNVYGHDDLTQPQLHEALAIRRVYLHPFRWTSLGLSLLEAAALGVPIVALAMTEVVEAIPRDAGVVSNN
ncbi:MAG TPA: glycosyltransferase family 4 protein, partial [Mycobacteriales bacterium]|nr:glycosyltransferase family 4 protein [Mycobacteriales bacterium]